MRSVNPNVNPIDVCNLFKYREYAVKLLHHNEAISIFGAVLTLTGVSVTAFIGRIWLGYWLWRSFNVHLCWYGDYHLSLLCSDYRFWGIFPRYWEPFICKSAAMWEKKNVSRWPPFHQSKSGLMMWSTVIKLVILRRIYRSHYKIYLKNHIFFGKIPLCICTRCIDTYCTYILI